MNQDLQFVSISGLTKLKVFQFYIMNKVQCYLEAKRLVHMLAIISDLPFKQTNIESECLLVNLQMKDCRMGCVNCAANELFAKLERVYDMKDHDFGKKNLLYCNE